MKKNVAHQKPAKEKSNEPLPLTPCSPVVEWQGCKLRMKSDSTAVPGWVLRINGRTVLTAIAQSDVTEAVTKDDRKLIAQSLVEYLANVKHIRDDG